jgi:hypothetical protein
MSTSDINSYHQVVVRRAVIGRSPFIWEIKDKLSDEVVRRSARSFVSLAEAHLSGTVAIMDGRRPRKEERG